jgi:hypothetical protein
VSAHQSLNDLLISQDLKGGDLRDCNRRLEHRRHANSVSVHAKATDVLAEEGDWWILDSTVLANIKTRNYLLSKAEPNSRRVVPPRKLELGQQKKARRRSYLIGRPRPLIFLCPKTNEIWDIPMLSAWRSTHRRWCFQHLSDTRLTDSSAAQRPS